MARPRSNSLEKEVVDLVLMDCQMPQMDGFKATTQLRAKGIETPVVALTANACEEDAEQCLAAGMNDFPASRFGCRKYEPYCRNAWQASLKARLLMSGIQTPGADRLNL